MDFLQTIKGFFKEENDQLKVRALKARATLREVGCVDFMQDLYEMFPEAEEEFKGGVIYNVCVARAANLKVTQMLEQLAKAKSENCTV